jgi:ketosteroid isomerase-like protein
MKNAFKAHIYTTLLGLIFILSCNNSKPPVQQAMLISVDSLNALWNAAWNNKDSSAVVNLIANDALLISGRSQIKGVDSISSKFVHHFIGTLTDLQTRILESKTWSDGCYLSGTYVFQDMQSGKLIGKEEGVYTFIWEKQPNSTLKLKILHMQEYK